MNPQYHVRMGSALCLGRPGGLPRHDYWTQKNPAAWKKSRQTIRSDENGAERCGPDTRDVRSLRTLSRRSKRFAPFLLQSIFFLAASVVSYGAAGVVKLYDGPSGSVYSYEIDWGYALDFNAPATSKSQLFRSHDSNNADIGQLDIVTWAYPGRGTTPGTHSGTFTVPAGETHRVTIYTSYWTSPSTTSGNAVGAVVGGLTGTIGAGLDKEINLTIPSNTSDFIVTYRLVAVGTGATLGEWSMAPGTPASNVAVTGLDGTTTAGDVELVYKVNGYDLEGESWKPVPAGTETFLTVLPPITSANVVDAGTIPSVTNRVAVIPPTKVPVVGDPGTGAAGTVWNTSGTGTAPTDALTNTVFREGVDKIVKQQQIQIDAEKEKKEESEAEKAAFEESVSTGGQAAGKSKVDSEYEAAKTSITSNIDGGGVVQSSLPSGSSIWSFTVSGVAVNIFPFGDILTGANIIKLLLQAIMIYAWIVFMQLECRDILKAAGLAPQARGNTLAGSGGQFTAAAGATLLTIIILAVPVAMAALSDNGIGWRTTVNFIESFTSGGTIGSSAVEWLSEYFPILTFLAIMNNVVLFKIAGTAIMGAAMVAAKWVIFLVAFGALLNVGSNRLEADVTWRNSSAVDILINGAVTVTANSTLEVAPAAGSMYLVEGAFGERGVEALDLALVCVTDEGVSVAHPSSAWWVYVLRGFVMGMLANLAGMVVRLFSRVGGGVETP